MQCPRCKDTMRCRDIGDISLHECLTCQAMWFEHGALDDVKDEVLPEMAWLDIDNWIAQADLAARRGDRVCPRCHDVFMTTVEDRQSGTQLDTCPQCSGTWLPGGQFLILINALLDQANLKTAPEYARISLQKAKDMLTGTDSFVSDWEDLKSVLDLLRHRIFIQHPKLKSMLVGLQKSLPL